MQLTFYVIFHPTITANAFLSTLATTEMSVCQSSPLLHIFCTLFHPVGCSIQHMPCLPVSDSQLVCAKLSAGSLWLIFRFFFWVLIGMITIFFLYFFHCSCDCYVFSVLQSNILTKSSVSHRSWYFFDFSLMMILWRFQQHKASLRKNIFLLVTFY